MNPDELEDLPRETPADTLLRWRKKHFRYIQSEGTHLFELYKTLFYSGLFFDSFLSFPMTLYSSYSNDTTEQAILEYFVSFTDLVDSICPFTISNSSASISHKTNTATSTHNSLHSPNTETTLRSPKPFLEKNILSSLNSRKSTHSTNYASLNTSFASSSRIITQYFFICASSQKLISYCS